MLGARKMQVNETGQQMGVDQLAGRTVRDSGRVVGNPYLIALRVESRCGAVV